MLGSYSDLSKVLDELVIARSREGPWFGFDFSHPCLFYSNIC